MPTSKDTRVRVDDLEKIIAHVCPASGLAMTAALRLELGARVQQRRQFGRREVGLLEEMLHENGKI